MYVVGQLSYEASCEHDRGNGEFAATEIFSVT